MSANDWSRKTFLIEIAGLSTRFYSTIDPTGAGGLLSDNITTGIPYTSIKALPLENGDMRLNWEVRSAGGVVDYDAIRVSLWTEGKRNRATDPARVLDRYGFASAEWSSPLVETIEPDTVTPDIKVEDQPPVGWAYPRIIHVGAEAFRATAVLGAGIPANPWRFTTSDRSIADTLAQRHVLDPRAPKPRAVSDVVFFRGRVCRILEAEVVRGKIALAYREIARGFLEVEPRVSAKRIELRVMPLTALLDMELGRSADNLPIGLKAGWHEVQPPIACAVEFQVLKHDTAGPTTSVDLYQTFVAAPTDPVTLMEWPNEPLGIINAALTVISATEALNIIVRDDENSSVWYDRSDATQEETSVSGYSGAAYSELFSIGGVVTPAGAEPVPYDWLMRYGLDLGRPDIDNIPFSGSATNRPRRIGQNEHGRPLPEGEFGWLDRRDWTRIDTPGRVNIRGMPSAHYEAGESSFLADAALSVPAGGYATLEVAYYDRARDEVVAMDLRIITSASVALPNGDTAYRLTIHADDVGSVPSFGDWPGKPTTEMRPSVVFTDDPAPDVMLQLLESSTGASVNGAYDVQPYGAGIKSEWIDEESFFGLASPEAFETFSPRLPDDANLKEVFDDVLLGTTSMVVMTTQDDGQIRIARVPAGMASQGMVRGSVSDRDFAKSGQPINERDDTIINQVIFLSVTDSGVEVKTPIRSVSSFNIRSGEASTREIDMRAARPLPDVGTRSAAVDRYTPIAFQIFTMFGATRRTFSGTLRAGALADLQPGGVLSITSDYLRATDYSLGITAAPTRVLQASIDLLKGTASFRATYHGLHVTGWNASGLVTSTPFADTIVLSANEFSATTSPVDGSDQRDIDGFEVGDLVRIEPAGDEDNALQLSILTLVRATNTIQLSGAHLLVAPFYGYIVPPIYDAPASTAHKALGYLADAAGTLGAAGDVGVTLT